VNVFLEVGAIQHWYIG